MEKKICAVGDVILMESLPDDYDLQALKDIICQADMKLFNLEEVLCDEDIYASSYCGGTWLMARTKCLDEVLKFGFNGCGYANNHTMDYSYDGLFATKKALADRSLPGCGAGKDLEEAASYVKIQQGEKKIGLISICSTFNDAARAGDPDGDMPGRPGLNPLRFSTVYQITPEHMKSLKEMAAGTCIDGRRNRSRMGGYTPAVPEGQFGFGEYFFEESEVEGKRSKPKKEDVERTVREIQRAKAECGQVFVYVHSHEIKHEMDDEPDDFLVEFCHACAEAGASAVFGTGTHQLKAVEVYKGCPIFYSLGNFIFQTDQVFCLPADFNEKYHYPAGISTQEKIARRSAGGTKGLHADVNNFRSLMPFMTFEDGILKELKLYPLRLNMETGLPALADAQEAEVILNYMNERNAPYGTKLARRDSVIVWEA